jgi:hypothetical protein
MRQACLGRPGDARRGGAKRARSEDQCYRPKFWFIQ